MKRKPRLLRITTVPISLKLLLNGQMSFFNAQGYDVLAVSAAGPEIAAIKEEGITHEVVNMTRKITPVQDLRSLIQLIKVIRRFKPDIVHSHTPKAGLIGMMAAFICRVPIRFHTVAGLPLMESKGVLKKILILVEKITYWFATAVFVNSNGLKDYITTQISSSRKISVLGKGSSNGINVNQYQRTEQLEAKAIALREQHQIGAQDIVFSFVGRIVKDKGVGEIVFAFRKLIDEFPDKKIFLLMVGHFEQDLDPLIDTDYQFLTTNERVILPGFQRDVRPWIMASDVFVFPSYREGFPNVVMQACCLNVPCIVSDINGCNEIVRQGETGMIVRPKDPQALYQEMKFMISQKDQRTAYAQRARAFVVENFDQRYIWSLLKKTYEEYLMKTVKS